MKQFSWLDATIDRCCPKCLSVMEETVLLERRVKFLTGELAAVSWKCPQCDFRQSGQFNYEGRDPESTLVDDHIGEKIREAKERERAHAKQVGPIKTGLRERPHIQEAKVFESDEEAMQAVFPDAVSGDELLSAINAFFPETLEYQDKLVTRSVVPEKVKMGERGQLDGYSVTYTLDGVVVSSNTYLAPDGIPATLEEDARKAALALQSMLQARVAQHAPPPQPKGFSGRGVRIPREGGPVVERGKIFGAGTPG